MKRIIIEYLVRWAKSEEKKPLILRGARQVGKTWAVRETARQCGYNLIEINFERNPEYGDLFAAASPAETLRQMEAVFGKEINPEKSILFLDEIQACSHLLSKLRWFYEELPALSVVAAGSLLEFSLEEHDFSMPVGRVTHMYMEPMSFMEFLWALGEEKLADAIENARKSLDMPNLLHQKALKLFGQYIVVGGMPSVVDLWVKKQNISECIDLQTDLLTTFRDDFNKYRKKVSSEVLRYTLQSTAAQLGTRFMYTRVESDVRQPVIKTALEMLTDARLCRKIYHTAANGTPLGAEVKTGIFKVISLDIGLSMNMLGLRIIDPTQIERIVWSNKGAIAEQAVGQMIAAGGLLKVTDIYYWQQSGSGAGEIDYIIQNRENGAILPIEVKAGSSGAMKSLHAFMESKKLELAYRFDINSPSEQQVSLKTNAGRPVQYRLISLPLYMAELL